MTWLIDHLCFTGDLPSITHYHFFCNSGGIYIHIPEDDEVFKLLANGKKSAKIHFDDVFEQLTWVNPETKERVIHPRFVDANFIQKASIKLSDAARIAEILADVAREFQEDLLRNLDDLASRYHIDQSPKTGHDAVAGGLAYRLYDDAGDLLIPQVDMRYVHYGCQDPYQTATVQITLKPILSFRHAKTPESLFGHDFRTQVIKAIQSKLDSAGFDQYVARPGGRSSIDVTLEKVDKAYAVEFLIDRLNLQPSRRRGLKFGSNAIYLGDEVIVGDGNDYPVTRIPGLLVFAVNSDRMLVPSISHVLIPSTILEGADAVASVLSEFNGIVQELITEYVHHRKPDGQPSHVPSAVEVFEERIFVDRIKQLVNNWKVAEDFTIEDLQVLHTFVTLMCRNDQIAHRWLAILVSELDAIMTHVAETNKAGTHSVVPEPYSRGKA